MRIFVTNRLPEHSSVHWHGMILPSGMDGVGGLSHKAIPPGKTYVYEFDLVKSGTFMYHPHADEMVQMAMGMMGMFVVHPRDPSFMPVDRDFCIMLNAFDIVPGSYTPRVMTMTDFNLWCWNSRLFPDIDPLVVGLGDLLALHSHPDADCVEVRERVRVKRNEADRKIGQLMRVRDARDEMIASGPGNGALRECSILSALSDSRNGRIQVFDLNGDFKRMFGQSGDGQGDLGRPMNLTIHDGWLYVPEYFNDRIQVFGLDGTPRRIIGCKGDGGGEFNAPTGVMVAPNGDLYVADFSNHRVQQLRPDGAFVRQWGTTGEPGRGAGSFIYPTDAALGADGQLLVADGYADRVQAFGPDGAFSHKWGGPFAMDIFGPFNGWFATVASVAIGPEGNAFVAYFYNDRVQKFSPDVSVQVIGSALLGPAHRIHG